MFKQSISCKVINWTSSIVLNISPSGHGTERISPINSESIFDALIPNLIIFPLSFIIRTTSPTTIFSFCISCNILSPISKVDSISKVLRLNLEDVRFVISPSITLIISLIRNLIDLRTACVTASALLRLKLCSSTALIEFIKYCSLCKSAIKAVLPHPLGPLIKKV